MDDKPGKYRNANRVSVPCQHLNEEGSIVDVNSEWLRLMGYKKGEVVGKRMTDFLPKKTHKLFEERFKEFLKTGIIRDLLFKLIKKDGTGIYVEANGKITRDKKTREKITTCIIIDVTDKKKAEQDLQISKERLDIIIHNLNGSVYTCKNDKYWTMEFISDGIKKIAKYPASDFVNNTKRTYESIIHPDDRVFVRELINAQTKKNKPFVLDYRIIDKSGSIVWVRERGRAKKDSKGRIRYEGIILEISEEKALETEVKKEKERVAQYLEIAGVMFIALDKKGRVTLANKKAEEILKLKKDKIIGKNWFTNFIPEKDRKKVEKVHKETIKKGNVTKTYFENDVINGIGEHITIGWHNTIYKDKLGNVAGTLSSGEDITEKKKVYEQLRENEEKYQALFDNSPDALFLYTLKGEYVSANKAALKMYGFRDFSEIKKLLPFSLSFDNGKNSKKKAIKYFMSAKKKRLQIDWVSKKKDGTMFYSKITLSLVKINNVPHILSDVRDVTENKTRELELIQHNKDLEIFKKVAIEREHKMIRLEEALEKLKAKN